MCFFQVIEDFLCSGPNFETPAKNEIFDDLLPITRLWTYISCLNDPLINYDYESESKLCEPTTIKFLQVLYQIQNNPYWRQLINCFYWKYYLHAQNEQERGNFPQNFECFVKQVVAFTLITLTIDTSDAKNMYYTTRHKIMKEPWENLQKDKWWLEKLQDQDRELKDKIAAFALDTSTNSKQATRALLLLHSYLDPKQNFVSTTFDIEHIFAKKQAEAAKSHEDTARYFGMPNDSIDNYLESIGNKMPLEKEQNIVASDKAFSTKQKIYWGYKLEATCI